MRELSSSRPHKNISAGLSASPVTAIASSHLLATTTSLMLHRRATPAAAMRWGDQSLVVANAAVASTRNAARVLKTFSRSVQSAVDPRRTLAYSPAHTRRRHDREQTKLRHGRRTSLPLAASHESLLTHVRGCRRQSFHEAASARSSPSHKSIRSHVVGSLTKKTSPSPATIAAVRAARKRARSLTTHSRRSQARHILTFDRTRRASVIASNRSRKGFASFAPLGRVLFRELFLCAAPRRSGVSR